MVVRGTDETVVVTEVRRRRQKRDRGRQCRDECTPQSRTEEEF